VLSHQCFGNKRTWANLKGLLDREDKMLSYRRETALQGAL